MAHPKEVRTAVRGSYVHEKLPLEAAAERHDIPVATARRWKQGDARLGDDWDKARAAGRLSTDGRVAMTRMLLEDFIRLHQATQQSLLATVQDDPLAAAEALSRLADAFTKVMSAVGKATPELSALALVADFVAELVAFVERRAPDATGALLDLLPSFSAHLQKKYG